MSKAFTREDDALPDRPVIVERASVLPPGASNYLTRDGAERLRNELEQLVAAPTTDGTWQQRVYDLQQILQSAVVVPPPDGPIERVRFGATVIVRRRDGNKTTYRIVGVDETDPDRGWVSWLSPIARALMNRSVGDRLAFTAPTGEVELDIIGIS